MECQILGILIFLLTVPHTQGTYNLKGDRRTECQILGILSFLLTVPHTQGTYNLKGGGGQKDRMPNTKYTSISLKREGDNQTMWW